MAACLLFFLFLVLLAGACRSAECAEGLQLVDGRCGEPICGTCPKHEFCDTSVVPAECRCAAGYEGDPCVFAKLIEDPGFEQELGAGPWMSDGVEGATVLPTAGDIDPGEGALDDASVICNAGSLLQVVEMPSYDLAEPFVVEVNYKAQGVHGLAIGFNRSWKRLPPADSSWRREWFCLGDGGYGEDPDGGEVEVRISASERLVNCLGRTASIRVDHFTIRQAEGNECLGLEPGSVPNGDVDASDESWGSFTEGNAEAGWAPGEGRDGTSGMRLAREAGETGRATMTTQISVALPATLPSPALRFWWRGSSDALFDVDLGTRVDFDDRGRQFDTLAGTGSRRNPIYCLPPWTHGSVLDLSFSLPDDDSSEVELVIDDVAITSDPDCGNEEDLLDPGFESAPNRWPGASVSSMQETVLLQPDSMVAHEGSGLLELSYENVGAELAMETYVLVPQSEDEQGPAVTFHSLSPATLSADVKWVLGRTDEVLGNDKEGEVQTEVTWEPNEVCLPPHWVGRWFRLQVKVESSAGPERQERIWLDDFFLGTSAVCPTK